MKIALSALIGSQNLGDEAIASIVIDKFEKLPTVESLTVLSLDPDRTRKMTARKSTDVVPASLMNLARAVKKADALVIGGGGIIQDESSVMTMIDYFLRIWIASAVFKKQVYLLFVGVGPVKSHLGSFLLGRMARHVTRSLVRDVGSKSLLLSHGFASDRVIEAYDVVFDFEPKITKKSSRKKKGDYILFCPRDWFFLRTYIPTKYALKLAKRDKHSDLHVYRNSLLRLVTKTLETTDLQIVAVAFYYTQDKNLIEWIGANIPEKYRDRYVTEKELTPQEYAERAAGAKAVLGVRLHSLILATATTPVVPMVYSSKVRNLVNYMKWDDFTTFLDEPDFAPEKIVRQLQSAIATQGSKVSPAMLKKIRSANEKAFRQIIAEMEKHG